MITPPLPPEITSAEEHILAASGGYLTNNAVELQKQRDLAIWNAAIEKAAEVAEEQAKDDGIAAAACMALDAKCEIKAQQERALAIELAILNLKRKE